MRFLSIVIGLGLGLVAAACGGSAAPTAPSSSSVDASAPPASVATSPSAAASLTVVTLGDSWPQGNHCGGCRTFAGRYADGLADARGETVAFVDLSGEAARESTTLLASLQSSEAMRQTVADADVVLIATGPNEMDATAGSVGAGTCGGADGFDCIRALGATWASNFESITSEIETLRAGQPTAIRFVNAANPFISVPEMTTELGLPDDFATTGGALLFQSLTDAMCDTAEAHGAACVDVRPIINGPAMDQPGDENSLENHQAIADALVALGLPELGS
jgi:hypothetical protein